MSKVCTVFSERDAKTTSQKIPDPRGKLKASTGDLARKAPQFDLRSQQQSQPQNSSKHANHCLKRSQTSYANTPGVECGKIGFPSLTITVAKRPKP